MWYVIQKKKDKTFYNAHSKWVVEIEKARLFKRRGDLTLFLNHNMRIYYIDKGRYGEDGVKGLPSHEKGNRNVTTPTEFEIIEIQLKVKNEMDY